MSTKINTYRKTFFACLGLVLAQSGVVNAQVEEGDEALEEVLVTGTRIERSVFEASSPVTRLDKSYMEDMSVSSVEDIFRSQPGFGVGRGSQNSQFASEAGSSFVNLRGLGSDRTLVLIDGRRRVAGSAESAAVDTNLIPAPLIKSVDILTGGASAVYGADAVTGVVNVSLDREFEGFTVGAEMGRTSYGEASESRYHLAAGGKFDDDRGHVTVGLSYTSLGPLASVDQGFSSVPWRLLPSDLNTGPNDGVPAFEALLGFRFSNVDPAGTICAFNTDGEATGRYIVGDGQNVTVGDQGFRDFQSARDLFGECGFINEGPGDGFNLAKMQQLRVDSETTAVITSVKYELTESVTAFAEFDYAHSESISLGQGTGNTVIQIARDNAFLPAELAVIMDAPGFRNAQLGQNGNLARLRVTSKRDTWTAIAGLNGDIGNYSWETHVQHGEFTRTMINHNTQRPALYRQATDAVIDPLTGDAVCRDPSNGCLPLNMFGLGNFDPEARDWVLAKASQHVTNKQTVAGAHISGDLLTLPAGPVKVVAGVEYREESFDVVVDELSQTGLLSNSLGSQNAFAQFDVSEAFVETVVPIIADKPLIHDLSLEGAFRYSDYSTIGNTTAWKLGGSWAVNESLRFRVTRSESTRAPSLFELFGPEFSFSVNVFDPCDAPTRMLTANRDKNCLALGLPAGWEDPNRDEGEDIRTGSNPDLTEETSDSWTFGLVFRGDAFGGVFGGSIDYWTIEIVDAIQAVALERVIDGCVDLDTIDNEFCPLIDRDSEGGIFRVTNRDINLATLEASGIDFQVDYSHEAPAIFGDDSVAQMSVALFGTYMLKNEELSDATDPTSLVIREGEVGFPDVQVNLHARYASGPISLGWVVRYIGSVVIDRQVVPETYPLGVDNISGRVYNDLNAYWAYNDTFRLKFGIRNAFNKRPPNTPQIAFLNAPFLGTGIASHYGNIGRLYTLGIEADF